MVKNKFNLRIRAKSILYYKSMENTPDFVVCNNKKKRGHKCHSHIWDEYVAQILT